MLFILVVIFLIIISSLIAVFVRYEDRQEKDRLKNENFTADDFEIEE